MGPKVSGFLLGFNLDDEVNVIPNRTQKSIHAKVGTFESAGDAPLTSAPAEGPAYRATLKGGVVAVGYLVARS